LMISTIVQTLGLRDAGQGTPLEELIKHLRGRRMLLLLDNFEQVVDAALDVVSLLEGCPHLTALVTSREILSVRGEQDFFVPPLALPEPSSLAHLPSVEGLMDYPAVELFVTRSRQARPDFSLTGDNALAVAGICARLDGLP